MDFFGRQARARRLTRWLIVVFVLAVAVVSGAVGVVLTLLMQALDGHWHRPDGSWLAASADGISAAALLTAVFILGASLLRHLKLRAGGGEVALALGGEPVLPEDRDPGRRRLRNVVEEMAIASGIPAPQAYVLEGEAGINAFAAGRRPEDAAVAVTRGALDRLSRAELQGVVAHEFSHILNGDMRLNLRLAGYLFGILAVSTIGRAMLRGSGRRGIRTGRGGAAVVFVLAGAALYVLGYAGVVAGRVIQAAVSRQRELLADAAAVQFTRQTEGLAGALRKIAGLDAGSRLRAVRVEEVSHMLFASGRRARTRLFATHPPLAERLAALGAPPSAIPSAIPAPGPADVVAAVGTADAPAHGFASGLAGALPATAWSAAHRSDLAIPCLCALLLDPATSIRQRQLGLLRARLGDEAAEAAATLADTLAAASPAERLALADVIFPVVRQQPAVRRDYLRATIDRLADVDGDVDVFEALLAGRMAAAVARVDGGHAPAPAERHARAEAAVTVLAALALGGHEGPVQAAEAFRAGAAVLGRRWPVPPATPLPTRRPPAPAVRAALTHLGDLEPDDGRTLVAAMAAAAARDGRLRGRELAMLRAACGALGLPLPPSLPAGGDAR